MMSLQTVHTLIRGFLKEPSDLYQHITCKLGWFWLYSSWNGLIFKSIMSSTSDRKNTATTFQVTQIPAECFLSRFRNILETFHKTLWGKMLPKRLYLSTNVIYSIRQKWLRDEKRFPRIMFFQGIWRYRFYNSLLKEVNP